MQVVEEPTIPLIEALMSDPTTDVIVATGGTAVVRAAYRSGNPAWGVGPGNVPGAGRPHCRPVRRGAVGLMDSKSFDNSILCTNESCVIVEERVADAFQKELGRHGGLVLSPEDVATVREALYPEGRMRVDLVGKDAQTLAHEAGIRVSAGTRVLVAPFSLVVPEEPLAREKLFPLLGLVRVPDARRGIDAARAMLRIGGAGHSAAIHSHDPRTIMAYGAAVQVLRVAVNVGGQHRLRRHRHQPGPDHDGRHRVRRPLVAGGEPRAPAPDQPHAGGVRVRPGRAVRRLRRPAAVERRAATPSRSRRPRCRSRSSSPARRSVAWCSKSCESWCTDEWTRPLMAELRSFIFIDQLQPQTMCYLGTWIRGRLPRADMAAQVIEISPGLDIEPLTDVALKSHRRAGRHPHRRASVRLPRDPLALHRGRAVGERRGARRAGRRAPGRRVARRSWRPS